MADDMVARRAPFVLILALCWALAAVPATAQTAAIDITGSGGVNAGNADAYVVSGTADAGTVLNVTVTDAGGGSVTATVTAGADGSFAVPLDLSGLADGTVTVTATGPGGTDVAVEVKDVIAPAPPVVTLEPLTPANLDAYVVLGTAEPAATVRVTLTDRDGEQVSATVVAGLDGSFLLPALDLSGLADGRLAVTVEASDAAGNVSVAADLLGEDAGSEPAPSVQADPVGEGDPESTFAQPEGDLTVVFEGMTGEGALTVVRAACDPERAPHGMRLLDVCYDISLSGTARFERARVTLPYTDEQLADAAIDDEADLVALHFGSGGVDDITTDIDEAGNQVTGTVDELGTFALGAYNLERLSGADRIETAARISAATFGPGVEVAFAATARDFPDALAGGPAAAGMGAPILLVDQDVPAATDAELRRLAPGRIVVLGGQAAVSANVESALAAYTTGGVTRLGGADRYATAAAIARDQHDPGVATVYVATGRNFPDALSGGAAAADEDAPLLLVDGNIPQTTAAELVRLQPGRIVVLGGPVAVSDEVEQGLRAYAAAVVRLAGGNRYETAARIAASFAEPNDPAFVATGENFPDALTGTPPAGMAGGPLVLVARTEVPGAIAAELERLDPSRAVVLGGEVAVSAGVADALKPFLRE